MDPEDLGFDVLTAPDPLTDDANIMQVEVWKVAYKDYNDAIKVQLLPENANGVTAAEVTIPPGETDAKVIFKIPKVRRKSPEKPSTASEKSIASSTTRPLRRAGIYKIPMSPFSTASSPLTYEHLSNSFVTSSPLSKKARDVLSISAASSRTADKPTCLPTRSAKGGS